MEARYPEERVEPFTADPAVSLRPGASGIDIVVRYVTRASARFEVRNRLYKCVIGLLQKPIPSRSEATPSELSHPQNPIPA